MQTHDGLLQRRVLPTLLGLTLLGGVAAMPAFAQSDRDHKTNYNATWDDEDMMPDPAPMSYPQAAPGSLHLYHWKDYTQTKMAPGSASDKRGDNDHKKDKKRHERAASYHRTLTGDPQSDTASVTVTDIVPNGDYVNTYSNTWSDSPWGLSHANDIVFWPNPVNTSTGDDFVYVLRGNTIYQMHVGDFSLAAQNTLPWLNSQTDYDMPMTAQGEDMDVYNKRYSQDPATGNYDTERFTSTIRPDPDFPLDLAQNPDPAQNNDNSDLKGRTLFHRTPGTDSALRSAMTPATISAIGDYIYVMRGNTLFQLRVSDLSLVNQTELPATSTEKDIPREELNPDNPNPDMPNPDMPNP